MINAADFFLPIFENEVDFSFFLKFYLTPETGEGGTRRARSTTQTQVAAAPVTGRNPVSASTP